MQKTLSDSSFLSQNLAHLSSEALHVLTLKAAQSEKEATLVLLEHLMVIEELRVYAVMGYPSLWIYVHQALGFSESQTSERINAMRLMKKIPSVKKELESGNLTLTVTSKLASHVKREECTEEETQALLQAVTGKSTREAERVLAQDSSLVSKPDQIKPLTQELTRIIIEVDSEFLSLLKRAQELGGHPGSKPQELFKMGLSEFVKRREVKEKAPKEKPVKAKAVNEKAMNEKAVNEKAVNEKAVNEKAVNEKAVNKKAVNEKAVNEKAVNEKAVNEKAVNEKAVNEKAAKAKPFPNEKNPEEENSPKNDAPLLFAHEVREEKSRSRYIPKAVKVEVRLRSKDQCEYVHQETGKRCESRMNLE